jgi:hypothetical protein
MAKPLFYSEPFKKGQSWFAGIFFERTHGNPADNEGYFFPNVPALASHGKPISRAVLTVKASSCFLLFLLLF